MRSSNATASAFGWEFQSNVAIMLMLKNIEQASKVKVEGNNEDIEITFSNGKMLMSQVKSVLNPDDTSHVKERMENGLRTLNEAAKLPNVECLVYVTNSPNPFNDQTTMFKFSSPLNVIQFDELPLACRNIISDICSSRKYDFNKGKLIVCVMQFHGENVDERYKVLASLTREFLISLEVYKISTETLLSLWQNLFSVNATQTATISKSQMVWPVIAIICEVGEDDAEFEGYDICDITETLQKYRSVINNNSERFEFVSRVLSDYSDYHPEMKSKEKTLKFIDERWQSYQDSIDLRGADATTEERVIRLTLANLLRSRRVIAKVKSKVKL